METIQKVKVAQMTSDRSGRPVANQFVIYAPEGRYFQSYQSIIAFVPHVGKTILDEYYWDYSRTTGKYRTYFLGENTNEVRKGIKEGRYQLSNLN